AIRRAARSAPRWDCARTMGAGSTSATAPVRSRSTGRKSSDWPRPPERSKSSSSSASSNGSATPSAAPHSCSTPRPGSPGLTGSSCPPVRSGSSGDSATGRRSTPWTRPSAASVRSSAGRTTCRCCDRLSACQYITKDAYPDDHPVEVDLRYGSTAIRGGSVIVAPTGEVLAGPVYDEETILYADIDPDAKTRSHPDCDGVGHYARPDVFELTVHSEPRSSVSFD